MSKLYVSSHVSVSPWLLNSGQTSQWYQAVATELAAKGITLKLPHGQVIANAADAAALFQALTTDPAKLAKDFGVSQAVIAGYVDKVFKLGDNLASTTSDVGNSTITVTPRSKISVELELTKSDPYATTGDVASHPGDDFSAGKLHLQLDPLSGHNFMDRQTFKGSGWSWPRDATEIEVNKVLGGVSGADLNKTLQSLDSRGRTVFSRVRQGDSLEPFTVGYSGLQLDELRWDADAHAARMKSPYVNLTIESGRYDREPVDPANPAVLGARQASLGTDDFFDLYADTDENALENLGLEYRMRDRRDRPDNVTNRRLLVAMKDGTVVDKDLGGVKLDHKLDVRSDGASLKDVQRLYSDALNGNSTWANGPLPPAHALFDALDQAGMLKTVGPHSDVLELAGQLYVDSLRSRLHFNESPAASLRTFMSQTTAKVANVLALSTAASSTLTGKDKDTVDAITAAANALTDGSAVAALAAPELAALDPATTWNADTVKPLLEDPSQGAPKLLDLPTLKKKKVVADATAKAYSAFADQVDSARKLLAGAADDALADYPDYFKEYWQQKDPSAFASMNTFDPFLEKYDAVAALPAADRTAVLADFNTWLGTQTDGKGKAPKALDDAGFKALRPQLQKEAVRIWSREIAEGGEMADGLYFDEARLAYAGANRSSGNFIISTLDWSNYVTPKDWDSIPQDIRDDPSKPLPLDKVFHTSLINELQIELGNEQPYTNAIKALKEAVSTDRASLMMRYLDSVKAPGIDPAKPESYAAAMKDLLAGKTAAATVKDFNAFLTAQKSALRAVTAADLTAIPDADFSATTQAAPVRTTDEVEQKLDGAQWVFQQFLDAQAKINDERFDRVKKELGRGGLDRDKLTWDEPIGSKLTIGIQAGRDAGVIPQPQKKP